MIDVGRTFVDETTWALQKKQLRYISAHLGNDDDKGEESRQKAKLFRLLHAPQRLLWETDFLNLALIERMMRASDARAQVSLKRSLHY